MILINYEDAGDQCVKERYLTCVIGKAGLAGDRWLVDGSVKDKWLALHSALVEFADEMLGSCKGKQCLKSADVLQPFSKDRNDA